LSLKSQSIKKRILVVTLQKRGEDMFFTAE